MNDTLPPWSAHVSVTGASPPADENRALRRRYSSPGPARPHEAAASQAAEGGGGAATNGPSLSAPTSVRRRQEDGAGRALGRERRRLRGGGEESLRAAEPLSHGPKGGKSLEWGRDPERPVGGVCRPMTEDEAHAAWQGTARPREPPSQGRGPPKEGSRECEEGEEGFARREHRKQDF